MRRTLVTWLFVAMYIPLLMTGIFEDYVPHCSPVNPMRNTMTPESRSTSSSTVSPRSGLGMPPAQVLQPHLPSSQVTPAQMGSSQIAASSHVPPFAGLPSTSNTPSSSAAATNAMFRVQMWSNNFDSGVQSLNHSSAPSVLSMSSLRAGSQISAISEDAHSHVELTDQQQLKFENIPPNIGRGSQDGETRNAIPELIHLLSDSDEVVVQRAATMVQNIAKMDSEQPPYTEPLIRASEVIPPLKELLRTRSNSPAIIKPTLGALFQISERPDGLESILRVNDQTDGALLTDIIQHIKFTGGSAIRYAILTFHTIIADKSVDNRNVERARDAGALQAVAHFLDRETNEKLLSVLVECVRLLCDKSHSQKMLFLQLNGPSKLLHILRNLRYEGLLWRTTQLLKTFSNADPQAIINSGGYEVLHRQLEHASQRLITSTLECIRNMSDVPTKDLDVSMLLTKLLQLLGSSVVILDPLSWPSAFLFSGHSQQVDAQKAVLQTEFAAEFLLRKLTEMRPSILKQTLQVRLWCLSFAFPHTVV
uniref:Armadillo repeat-containing domain-containing protein n=1 Tax=Ascaris lumbricoides TaxID=6252 RepID=A0A9J2PYW8_ASCLU